jgi:hypothetical protein
MARSLRKPHAESRVISSKVGGNIIGHARNANEKHWFRVFLGMVSVNPAILVLYIGDSERDHYLLRTALPTARLSR